MNCPACGAADQQGKFCIVCGAALDAGAAQQQPAQQEQPAQPAAQPAQPAAAPRPEPQPGAYPTAPAPSAPAPSAPPAPKKKRGCLWGCLTTFVLFVLGVVLLAGWMGFVPWLSRLIGPEPRDLGVEMTVDDAYACADAFSIPDTFDDLRELERDPSQFTEFDATLTSEQASSLLVLGQDDIPNWPMRFVQIRFNDDGTAEASGILLLGETRTFLTSNLGVPSGAVEEAISRVEFANNTTFYVKGDCSVQNNHVNLSLSEIEIGRFTVPGSWYQGKETEGTQYIDAALAREGFDVRNVSVGGGAVQAEGTRPIESLIPWIEIVRDDRGEE